MLDRDEDMISTGERHPFLGRYKVAYTSTGKLVACEMKLYNNAGSSFDLSNSVNICFKFILDKSLNNTIVCFI